MAQQNINQYVYQKYKINLISDSMDMSLTSDERDYDEEVLFSPYLIAETYGNKLPIYFDTNNFLTTTQPNLTWKNYNYNNVFVSQNFYNPDNIDFCNYSSSTLCDIGLTGIDNGLVDVMTGINLNYTNGLYVDPFKFNRLFYDRRMKMFQVTGHTKQYDIFSGRPQNTLYEIISKNHPSYGYYHELYGGFYQGFYKLFGYDYDILPERMSKGWSVEMLLRPRFCDEYPVSSGETTLNILYPNNKNTFFYFGTRAENKFYHYADGSPKCLSGYTRVTTPLADCLQTCACCSVEAVFTTGITPDYVLENITNSRCIFVYPPRSKDGKHDPHLNYGCDLCGGDKEKRLTCGCSCGEDPCETCGWECRTHKCFTTKYPTPTPTPTPSPTPNCEYQVPVCTPSCTTCKTCTDCTDCSTNEGIKSIEDTCEKDPLWDSLSNAMSIRFSGDPKNPKICVRVLKLTGTCETTGTTVTGLTFTTGYTVVNYCSPNGVYDYCEKRNIGFLDIEKWLQVDVVWSRYTFLDFCDLKYFGGLGDISEVKYLDSLANDTVKLISPPVTNGIKTPQTVELVNLNKKWLDDVKYRMGRLKIYVNGKRFFTIEDFEEVIPRALHTDKEKQVGVPFNISWGGGTQGLHENLTFSSCTGLTSDYIQDPECFPNNILSGTTFSKLKTNILLEQNFGGYFEGGITQFRMYVEPLNSSEVKHNFNLLKNKFEMFDPDCPNCDTKYCETNDLTYTINDYTTTTTTTTPIETPTPTPTNTQTPTPTNTQTPTVTPTQTPDFPCDCYELSGGSAAGSTFSYTDCRPISETVFVGRNLTRYVCASTVPTLDSGTGGFSLSPYTCVAGICGPPVTPTPTPTPTSTSISSSPFISIWSASSPIELPYSPTGTYSGTIDWGDGNITPNSYTNRIHNYTVSGDYTITITGQIEGWNFFNYATSYRNSLKEILQWGSLRGENNSNQRMFFNCSNLILTGVTDTPNLLGVTNLSTMFYGCSELTTVNNMNIWDVSTVANMSNMFVNATNFNQDISNWNVSNVFTMSGMFSNSINFNQNIGSWDVSSVQSMSTMFYNCTNFNNGNDPSINLWDVSSVNNMSNMFELATNFNQPLDGWDVSSVSYMIGMFANASSFNQFLGSWDVSSVMYMVGMFNLAINFNQNIGSWNVSNVVDMGNMFNGVTLSTSNYDSLLNGWASLGGSLQTNVSFSAGNSVYTITTSGTNRGYLTSTKLWIITDGGGV